MSRVRLTGFAALVFVAIGAQARAQQAQQPQQQGAAAAIAADKQILAAETYVKPAAEIERLVTAPREKNVTLTAATASPDRTHYFKLVTNGMPSVQTFGKPH